MVSTYARTSQKYVLRISLEGDGTGTLMSGAERARLFREHCKIDATRLVNKGASTCHVAVPEPMDLVTEDDSHTSVKDVSELMNINISQIDAVQDHWFARSSVYLVRTAAGANFCNLQTPTKFYNLQRNTRQCHQPL